MVGADAMRDTYHPNTAEYSPDLTRDTFPVDDLIYSYAMGWRNGVYRGHVTNILTKHIKSINILEFVLPFPSVTNTAQWIVRSLILTSVELEYVFPLWLHDL